MIDVTDDHAFHLYNQKISYICALLPNGQLGHLYFGPRLSLTTADLTYLSQGSSPFAWMANFSDDQPFALGDAQQEYPVYGTGDFRQGSLSVTQADAPVYPNFVFKDYQVSHTKMRDLHHPTSFGNPALTDVLTIHLEDETAQLLLTLQYTIFSDSATVVRAATLTNQGAEPVMIERMLSGALNLPQGRYDVVHLSGNWAKERHIQTQPLTQGTFSVESLRGASSHEQNPFVALHAAGQPFAVGDAYGANLVYSGNFLDSIEVNEWDQTRLLAGIHPASFSWRLDPKTSFTTPEVVLSFSSAGLAGLSQANQRFVARHIIDPQWRQKPRPVVLNSWEATYFDLNEQKLLHLAKLGRQLGVDCFVLDDGWFGTRDNDLSSLGDWFTNKHKFPDGLGHFAEEIHSLGLQFGLWFEPEMVSPRSQFFQEHPDWVVRPKRGRMSITRHQYVLDFSNPTVVNNIFAQMQRVITETKLDYVKWDLNRSITEAYSPYLAKIGHPQGEFFHRYVQGVYTLYQKLLTAFPHLLIEGRAGGGGRFDLGILFYSPQIWTSDDSDAIERLAIQSGTALAYPLSCMSNHVTAIPNEQVGRSTPLATRFRVAAFGILGYELDLTKLDEAALAAIKNQIAYYHELQPLVLNGDFRLLLPRQSNSQNQVAWLLSDHSRKRLVLGFFRVLADADSRAVQYMKIPVAQPNQRYWVNGHTGPVSGDVLQRVGVRLPIQFNGANRQQAQLIGDYQSALLTFDGVTATKTGKHQPEIRKQQKVGHA
ncbi:alpha-galactosidase [Lacticaseibacillus rhamnosus]|uniref:alpha-galactosidase n=2 Tax=Lacticaseibacillus rhamnosus TaxID=47715 RepID=UPI0005011765|nr:alpha-galactosidase [Lacticaseibacillus rhamnosus]KFK47223.1 alpha-galactosidase [Lacticaseibacillus rhamnosus]